MSNIADIDVSRETIERLELLEKHVCKWTKSINLVSKTTIPKIWYRHIIDSAQIWPLAPEKWKNWVDLGSGGGFPALVIAILAKEFSPESQIHFIESDKRKCIFLRTVIRELGLNGIVYSMRIEKTPPINADVISARALASLKKLLEFSEIHHKKNSICLFQKGKTINDEILEAKEKWVFDYKLYPSITDPSSKLIEIKDFSRV